MRFGVRVLAMTAFSAAIAASSTGMSRAESSGGLSAGKPETRVEIDGRGNLIVNHASGYKQIIVGGAAVLERNGVGIDELFDTPAADDESPSIIRLGDGDAVSAGSVTVIRRPVNADPVNFYGDCVYGTAVVRGRSYMYGLDRGQTPVLVNDCR
jgi:hypothetical protein